jgi:hypothetical protein
MKKPYQIQSQRAVKQLETMAADGNAAVQMVLPLAEMVFFLPVDDGWCSGGPAEDARKCGCPAYCQRLAIGLLAGVIDLPFRAEAVIG